MANNNEKLALTGIPDTARGYVINSETALAWLIDRYRVTTDKASGIVNAPNDYSGDPRYIINLIKTSNQSLNRNNGNSRHPRGNPRTLPTKPLARSVEVGVKA